jgi:CubicO group peptidase (beta-lactamase class C family)
MNSLPIVSKTIHLASKTQAGVTLAGKVNSICLKSSLLLGFLLLLQPVFSQYNFTEFDRALQQKQRLLGNNLVALICKGDSIIYKKELGGFNSSTQAPIASCSKWLTAALVMMFVDEGKISLDDPVVKYLPVFGNYFKNYITIRQCLSHMTGIQSEPITLLRLLQRRKYNSLEEEVNAFAAKEIQAKPGTEFRYSNIGLNIAGRILEVVSKKKFDVLIKQKLFNPLGMRKTSFSTMDGTAVNPSGGAVSTADDYMQFLIMLLNKGKYKGQQILSENAVNEMMQVQDKPEQIKYAPKAAEGFTYALGSWVMEDDKNGKATALTSPGLFGTWPLVDYCRGYAYIIFVKNLLGEERADAELELKKLIDKQMTSKCN